jgi:putative transposase
MGIQMFMQRAEGQFAQYYNRRKQRTGSFWEGRYHCTLIEGPTHLERCITYIELNMVRAGVVVHPRDWPWCSYQEWMGHRRRYRLIDWDRSLELLRAPSLDAYRIHSEQRIQDAIARGQMAREPHWTGGIAVGEKDFIDEVGRILAFRRKLTTEESPEGAWVLREDASDLGAGLCLESKKRHENRL